MKLKKAFITGISGQDGSYLTELLIKKNYAVHGIIRRSSLIKTDRIDHLFNNPKIGNKKLFLHYSDMTDDLSLYNLISNIKPDEIYNLAAQSHVKVSFELPIYTANSDALGTLRILECVRILKLKTKIYQASTSELFGRNNGKKLNELSPFQPISPYAVAKLYAHEIVKCYREAYGLFACNGILFNHESSRRGETFVTRKITIGLKNYLKNKKPFILGNLDSCRDWGHSKDYVLGMWKMLQISKPQDFVLATGNTHSIRDFIKECLKILEIKAEWKKEKNAEKLINKKDNSLILSTSSKYFRLNEIEYLKGDYSKAKKILKWSPKIKFKEIISEMLKNEIYQ